MLNDNEQNMENVNNNIRKIENQKTYAPTWIGNYPDKLQPRLQPGVYMILCLLNNFRYYGETSNLSMRLAGHKRDLRKKKHASERLQEDWNNFGEKNFEFSVLFIGEDWKEKDTRLGKETQLILEHPDLCYNTYASMNDRVKKLNSFFGKKHSEQTKRLIGDLQRGIPKDSLGAAVQINNVNYPSIAEASRQLGHSRKLIRSRVDNVDFPQWIRLSEMPNDYPYGSRGNASPEKTSNQD